MITTILFGGILLVFYAVYYVFMLWMSRGRAGMAQEPGVNPKVSVVVATYNEEAVIERKLQSLADQDYPGETELIIIDGASEDATVSLAEKFSKEKALKIIVLQEEERVGKASAINKAFERCTGDIIVMTDADAIWEPGSLRKALSNFADPEVGAVTGRQVLLNPKGRAAPRMERTYRNFYETLRVGESILDSTPVFHGELSCYRRVLASRLEETTMADDSWLAVATRIKGYRSIYDPDALFYEYSPPTLKSSFIQKVRRCQGLIQLFLSRRRLLFNPRYGKFGSIVLPAELFMHVVSPVLISLFLVSLLYDIVTLNWRVMAGVLVVLAALAVFLAFRRVNVLDFVASFLNSQLALLVALAYQIFGRSQHKWRKAQETRELWREQS